MINFLFRKAKGGGGQWVLIEIKQPRVPGFFFAYPLAVPEEITLHHSSHVAEKLQLLIHHSLNKQIKEYTDAAIRLRAAWTEWKRMLHNLQEDTTCSIRISFIFRALLSSSEWDWDVWWSRLLFSSWATHASKVDMHPYCIWVDAATNPSFV